MSVEADTIDENAPKKKRPIPIVALAAIVVCVAGAGAGYFLAPIALAPKAADHQQTASEKSDGGTHSTSGHENAEKASHKHGVSGDHNNKSSKSEASHDGDANGDCIKDCGDTFKLVGETGYYTPEPLIVSIRPGVRLRHLKIAIVVETAPDAEQRFGENSLRIRDTLTAYLRAVDPATLENPDAFGDIRTAIARRISAVVAPSPVRAVLITDFILT